MRWPPGTRGIAAVCCLVLPLAADPPPFQAVDLDEATDSAEWDQPRGYWRVRRGGAWLGFLVGADGSPAPRGALLRSFPADAHLTQQPDPHVQSDVDVATADAWRAWTRSAVDAGHRVAVFTDHVEPSFSASMASAREAAFSLGCWSAGGYTPDLCCASALGASGGWRDCWDGHFTYEACCAGGWSSHKDAALLDAARGTYYEALERIKEAAAKGLDKPHHFYMHALVLAGIVDITASGRQVSIAEIGVDEGVFAEHILTELARRGVQVARYYAIDPWAPSLRGEPGRGKASWVERQRDAFLSATQVLARFWPAPRVLQEYGDVACRVVPDESLDLAFVDAVHNYDFVTRHLEAWWPKVRPGGVIAGHDYAIEKVSRFPGTVGAVHAFASRNGLGAQLVGIVGTSFVLRKPA